MSGFEEEYRPCTGEYGCKGKDHIFDCAEYQMQEQNDRVLEEPHEESLEYQTQWARKRVRQGHEWMQRCTPDLATHFRSVMVRVVDIGDWTEK